ncbi:MAG TPA: hypothetical protein VGI39_01175 [Polyangiaceae bacterium]|jgi:hypothetical protein
MDRDRNSGVHPAARAKRESSPGASTVRTASFFARVLLLAGVAVVGSVWALVRFYTHVHQPMLVPVTLTSADAGSGSIAAHEIEIEQP